MNLTGWILARVLMASSGVAIIAWWAFELPMVILVVTFVSFFIFFLCIESLSSYLFPRAKHRHFCARRVLRNTLLQLALISTLVIGKLVWYDQMKVTGNQILDNSALPLLLERREYLLNQVVRYDFMPKDIPFFIESPFKEELAIATYSMTALALANIAFIDKSTQPESRDAVATLIERMLSKEVRRYEVIWWGEDALETLEGRNGHIGYLGHLNLMLGLYRLLGGDARHDVLHKKITDALAYRALLSPSYHVETFPSAIFTADNTVVMVSIALWGQIHRAKYDGLLRNYILYTKKHLLDKETGMVRYYVDKNGKPAGHPRGVLQAWNSMFLPLLNKSFAREQYGLMKKHLFDEAPILSLGGIREYPIGKSGPMDAISGPVVFGLSGSATGFAIGGAKFQNDKELLTRLLYTSEFVGSTIASKGERFYLLGPLVGEAIVLAGQTMTDFDTRYVPEYSRKTFTRGAAQM